MLYWHCIVHKIGKNSSAGCACMPQHFSLCAGTGNRQFILVSFHSCSNCHLLTKENCCSLPGTEIFQPVWLVFNLWLLRSAPLCITSRGRPIGAAVLCRPINAADLYRPIGAAAALNFRHRGKGKGFPSSPGSTAAAQTYSGCCAGQLACLIQRFLGLPFLSIIQYN